MIDFLKKYWVIWSNLVVLIFVIAGLSGTSTPALVLFSYIVTYIVSFLTALKLMNKKEDKDIAY